MSYIGASKRVKGLWFDRRWLALPAIILVLVLLSVVLAFAQATLVHFKFEAEQGALLGDVETASDSTASGGSMIAFTEPVPPSSGTFTDTFTNLDHWSFGHWYYGADGGPTNGSTATINNGRAYISTAEPYYARATLRSDRLYDIRSGGTFTFDVSLGDGNLPANGASIGNPFIALSDLPIHAPSYFIGNNGTGTGLRNGMMYDFWHTCAISWQAGPLRQFVNNVETLLPGESNCLGQVTMAEGQLNRVELRYNGNGGWQLWASNVNTTAPLTKLREWNMQVPEIGYFLLGSMNYAASKYSDNGSRTRGNATYDNVSYPAGGFASSYRNGQNVTKGTATTAHVAFNGRAPTGNSSFSVTINGTVVPFTPFLQGSRNVPGSVEIPLSLVNNGNNTVSIQGLVNVSNVDLVLTRPAQ